MVVDFIICVMLCVKLLLCIVLLLFGKGIDSVELILCRKVSFVVNVIIVFVVFGNFCVRWVMFLIKLLNFFNLVIVNGKICLLSVILRFVFLVL